MADLLSRALQVSRVAKEMSKGAIQSALNWMDCDGLDPSVRGEAILALLSRAIPMIRDENLLGRMATRVSEYAHAVPEMEEICSSYLDVMSAHLDDLTAPRAVVRSRDSKPVSGSIVVPPGNAGSSWFSDMVTEAMKRTGA